MACTIIRVHSIDCILVSLNCHFIDHPLHDPLDLLAPFLKYLSIFLDMKIICWNVQGAKKSQLRHEVGFINRTIKPDILILFKTLINCQNIDLIIKQLGYRYSPTIPPVNHMGGIWLLWNDEKVDVSIVAKETRIMHCLILDKLNAKECLLSAVYAPVRENQKDDFWLHLHQLHNYIDKPWCILGDFNEMLNASQKIGGIPLSPRYKDLMSFCITVTVLMRLCKEGHLLGKNFYGAN